MSTTMASPSAVALRVNSDPKLTANITHPRVWLKEIGQCLFRSRMSLGWTLEMTAAALGRDARQVRRWEAGEERTQVDTVLICDELREPFGREIATACGARVLLLFGTRADCRTERQP